MQLKMLILRIGNLKKKSFLKDRNNTLEKLLNFFLNNRQHFVSVRDFKNLLNLLNYDEHTFGDIF